MGTDRRESYMQLLKYGAVGLLNTGVTLFAIFICKSIIGINPYLSNAIGYTLGIINSFLWNRSWVFHSKGGIRREAILFFTGVGICYCIQLLCLYFLTAETPLGGMEWKIVGFTLSGYGASTLLASVVYTFTNFIYNKIVAFRNAE